MRRVLFLCIAVGVVGGAAWLVLSSRPRTTQSVATPAAKPGSSASEPSAIEMARPEASEPQSAPETPIAGTMTEEMSTREAAPATAMTAARREQRAKHGKQLLDKFQKAPTAAAAMSLANFIVQANMDLDGTSIEHKSGERVTFPPTDSNHRAMMAGFTDADGAHSGLYQFSRDEYPIYFAAEEFQKATIGSFDEHKQKQLFDDLTAQAQKTLDRLGAN
jgi:hypothetical protein